MASGGSIVQKISFENQVPVFERAGDYQSIKIRGLPAYGKPGAPLLPVKILTLLLPPSAVVKAVKAEENYNEFAGSFNILPAQKYQPISEKGSPEFCTDSLIYSSDDFYPPKSVVNWNQGNAGGYNLISLTICPFGYRPSDGRLKMLDNLTVTIEYDLNGGGSPSSEIGRSWVQNNVLNADLLASWYSPSPMTKGSGYDLLIVTTQDCDTIFQRLAFWKNQRGISAKVAVLDTIYSKYSGRDQQEKLRNFVIEQYQSNGISHVLLGGDYGIVPARTAFAIHSGYEEPGYVGIDSLICDLYYSDLDGDWDLNGNGIFGEPDDSIDMYPEIAVGRAVSRDVNQARTFVDKVLTYEATPPSGYLNKASFWASYLDVNTDAALGKEIIDRDYMTDYFRPVEKLYQSSGNENPTTIIQAVNGGVHLINHNGHSGFYKMQGGNGWLDTTLMDTLNNPGQWGILYSLGCQAAGFDSNCIAEHYVNNPLGGGLAFIGNSRYGWYFPSFPGYSPSDLYDNAFFDQLQIKQAPTLGQALAYSKADMIPLSLVDGYFRWTNYNLNLLGDPTLPVWTAGPETLQVICQDSLNVGSFILPVNIAINASPADRAIATLFVDSAFISASSDQTGQILLSGIASYAQDAILTVWSRNCIPVQKTIKFQEAGPYLTYSGLNWIELAGNGDSLAGPGETGSVDILIKNNGTMPSGLGALALLRAKDGKSTVLDSLADISGLSSGDSLYTGSMFSITLDSACQNGQAAVWELELVDSAGNAWQYNLGLTISAPHLDCLTYKTNDSTSGNGNGMIEPGEILGLTVSIKNIGQAILQKTLLNLIPIDSLTVVLQDADSILSLYPDSVATAEYMIKMDSLSPDTNYFPKFVIQGEYPGGNLLDTLVLPVGATGLDDQMESGNINWMVSDSSYWHISSCRSYSPGNSWYFGIEPERLVPYRATDTLLSKPFLVGVNDHLAFWQWFDFTPEWDYGFVELEGSFGSRLLDVVAGNSGEWQRMVYDLSGYSPGEILQLRFIAWVDSSGSGIRSEGWFIDDVHIGPPATGVEEISDDIIVDRFYQNRPNPFSATTKISFQTREKGPVELSVYNILGQKISVLYSGVMQPGVSTILWNGRDQSGQKLPGGVYLARLTVSGISRVRKMVMIK
jgi:hypothetical protein